jgi:hypothetical protein
MKTVRDVCQKALMYVGAVGAGQPYSAEDLLVASQAIRPMLDELAATDVCMIAVHPTLDDEEEIPDVFYLPLAQILAVEISPDFGAPFDPVAREAAIRRLRLIASSPSYEQIQTAAYY